METRSRPCARVGSDCSNANYLREHPEELRPGSRKLLQQATQPAFVEQAEKGDSYQRARSADYRATTMRERRSKTGTI